jgi:hypothetical protein
MGIPYMPWEELIPQCDVLSLHMPLLPSTKHFIDVSPGGGVAEAGAARGGGVGGGAQRAHAAAALHQALHRREGGGKGSSPRWGTWPQPHSIGKPSVDPVVCPTHPALGPSPFPPRPTPTPTPQARKVAMMKEGVTLLNVSRGGLIETGARGCSMGVEGAGRWAHWLRRGLLGPRTTRELECVER